MVEKIVEYIKRNRVSSTEVADCLGKTGALENISAVNRGHFAVGPVHYIYAHSESNWPIHEQARSASSGEIIIVDGINVASRALFGELVTKYMVLYCQVSAIVAIGNMRDANDLIKQNYPVWCSGFNPIGCFNNDVPLTDEVKQIVENRKKKFEGAVAVCDDTGVVVIPKEQLNEEFFDKLVFIERQEDKWFECIDQKKWDTYDTVCLKKYLNE